MPQSPLTEQQRGEILDAVSRTVTKKFYDPNLEHLEWNAALRKHRASVLAAQSNEQFDTAVGDLLKELKSSHVGLFHSGLERCSCKMALGAVYSALPHADGQRWVFQDVHDGGPAAQGGIRAGDILLRVDDRVFDPPEHPLFAMGSTVKICVLTRDLEEVVRTVAIPVPKVKRNQLPKVEPSPTVSQRRLNHDTGYMKIVAYPGEIGVEVANEIESAVSSLKPVSRLVIDLRGNLGGGIGVLRVMSLLTPDRRPVGVFSNGVLKQGSSIPEGSFVFDKIPATKSGLLPLAFRFIVGGLARKLAGRKMPISVVTEGLGPQPFHGKIVLLVNRHTASANEMLVAFAREHRLATIVGEATPGRVLGGSKFKLPYGYWLALPVGSFRTTDGNSIEGKPIPPDVEVPFDAEAARGGHDPQLETALQVVCEA